MTEKLRKTGVKSIDTITFDDIDQQILDILQRDSDTVISVISDAVGLSIRCAPMCR